MRFHLIKVIEGRPSTVVIGALEKCLKREAWEVRRHDMQVVALGIGTSTNTVNLSDSATFNIESSDDVTTVLVEAEYQHVWFLPEAFQNDTVQARFESVFANMRAALNLPSEGSIRQRDAEEPTSYSSENATPPNSSMTTTEPAVPPEPINAEADAVQETPAAEFERHPVAPPVLSSSRKAPKNLLQSTDVQQHFRHSAALLTAAFAAAVMSIIFGLSYAKTHLLSRKTARPSPSAQRFYAQPAVRARPLPSTLVGPENSSKSPNGTPASSTVTLEDPERWLERWAAAQRTRDAQNQASFYADEVRPYLALQEASRAAVYQEKQTSILNRKGLWTLKIEDISVQRESANTVSVLLKKHFMTQQGSVKVSEQRIYSVLTLERTPVGWQITGERDLPSQRQVPNSNVSRSLPRSVQR